EGEEVLVAPGTYTELLDFGGKAITVASSDGAPSTIIDGSGAGDNLVTFDDGEGEDSVLRGFTLRNGRERAVYVASSGPSLEELVIDEAGAYGTGNGLYVTGGTPTLSASTFSGLEATTGSDVYLDATSTVVIDGCTFDDGTSYYGAIYVDGGTLTLTDSTVSNHWSRYGGALKLANGAVATVVDTDFDTNRGYVNVGAAIQVSTGSSLTVEGGTFAWNWPDYGSYYASTGGAVLVHGTAEVRDATFEHNGGGYGAGAAVSGATASLTVIDARFEANGGYGGRGLSVTSSATLVVTGSTFVSNDSTWPAWGAAIRANAAGSVHVSDSTFCDGYATDGGAIWAYATPEVSLTNNRFHENVATEEGGAVWLGGVTTASIVNNTFAGNEAVTGGAVYLSATAPTFTNNLVASTVAGAGLYDASGLAASSTLTYNLWYDNLAADAGGALTAAD
ncbi:MAG: right-handed parallel beta-helix repeat-containing protein, partial [Myxococcota bacterium]